jgi:hypothetical protein
MKELSREKLIELLNKHGGYAGLAKALGDSRQAWHQKARIRGIKAKIEKVDYVYRYVTEEKKQKIKRIFF